LRGGPRGFDPGFTCPDLLRNQHGSRTTFAYGPLTLFGRTFQTVRLPARFVTPRPPCGTTGLVLQPRIRNARRLSRSSVWAISPFARHYSGNRDFLFLPPGTQMCHFPGFPPPALCVQTGVTRRYPCRVSPFGDPCFIARLRLHTAYRSLPRPSSAFGAKASTIRPYYLDGIGSRYAVFKDQAPRSRGCELC
jgi:hypothetical protein